MPGLMGEVAGLVERAMQFRLARQTVLASNLANVDTPGYRRADLHFDAALDRAQFRRTHPSHAAGGGTGPGGEYRLEVARHSRGPDRNTVDSDHETVEVSRNAGAFVQQAEVYARLMALTRIAVDGGGN